MIMINNSDYQGLDISLEASQLFHLTEGQNVKSAIQFLYHKQLGERMLAMKIHEKAMLRTTSIKVATDCWAGKKEKKKKKIIKPNNSVHFKNPNTKSITYRRIKKKRL